VKFDRIEPNPDSTWRKKGQKCGLGQYECDIGRNFINFTKFGAQSLLHRPGDFFTPCPIRENFTTPLLSSHHPQTQPSKCESKKELLYKYTTFNDDIFSYYLSTYRVKKSVYISHEEAQKL